MDSSLRLTFFFILIFQLQTMFRVVSSETNKNDIVSADKKYGLADQLRAYWNCYLTADRIPIDYQQGDSFCTATFDGLACWDSTSAGHLAKQPCPPLVSGHHANNKIATKQCLSTGRWAFDPETGEEISNYTQCPKDIILETDKELLFYLIGEFEKLEESPYSIPANGQAFEKCIDEVLSKPQPQDGRRYCPRTFDGWGCWSDTPAGEIAYIRCPAFITGFLPERFAHKHCNEDGTWYRHPDTNRTWSNYTTCVDRDDLTFRQRINNLYIAGYSTSLVAVTISLVIFCYFKSLQCTRITIHKNLFLSFIINNIMWIVWYTAVVQNPDVLMKNEIGCQILHVLVHYFLISNYFWMFCEGLYLHTLLVVAFVSEDKLMKWFYFLGWGTPAVLITAYAAVRTSFADQRVYCWIEESVYMWIISGPVCVSMTLNLIFLVNIVRVLVTKLRAVNSPDTHQTRKAARATLILIPLLGLHYVVTPFRPEPRSPGESIYETISAIVSSFQGLCVALLFCFFNGEVINLARNFVLKELSMRRPTLSHQHTTPAQIMSLIKNEWSRKVKNNEFFARKISYTSTSSVSTGRKSTVPNQQMLLLP